MTHRDYLQREREQAARDLTTDPHWSVDGWIDRVWLKGPRALACDLRVGTRATMIDGKTLHGRKDRLPESVATLAHDTAKEAE